METKTEYMPEGPYHIEIEVLDENEKPYLRDGHKISRLNFTIERYRMTMDDWQKELTRLHDDLKVIVREEACVYLTVSFRSSNLSNHPSMATWPTLCSYYGPEKRFVNHFK